MCLAIPARVIEIQDENHAKVEVEGTRKVVHIGLIENVCIGDYLIIHAGFALSRLDPSEAEKTLAYFREIASMGDSVFNVI